MTTTKTAGAKLRATREARGLKQADVVRASHGKLTMAQVSRIETGQLTKPPMKDLVEYGLVVGLSPNEVASVYGYYVESGTDRKLDEDSRLSRLHSMLDRLSPSGREKLLDWVDFAVAKAIADDKKTAAAV